MGVTAANLRLGPANVYLYELPRATVEVGPLRFRADVPGADGNSITVRYVVSGLLTPLSVEVDDQAVTVNIETNGAGAGISTAEEIRDAVMASFAARSLVYAVYKTGETGTTVVAAGVAATPLTGGSDTGVATDVGGLGEGLQVLAGTSSVDLTAAQTGDVPQDEVVVGGQVTFTIPFREMIFDNFARAIPNSRVIEGTDGRERLDFVVRVGESRRSHAVKLELRPLIGGVETTDPAEIYVVPEATAVAADVTIPFSPTTQQEMSATFRAWPDANGRWMFKGDEEV